MRETLEVGGLTFEVRRSVRRKTLGLTVDRGGELIIHCPESTNREDLVRWIHGKLLWVHRKLALKEAMLPKVLEPDFVTGESFSYLGRTYRLVLSSRQKEPLRFDGQRFCLRSDARATATDHFRRWYTATGREWIAKRVVILARKGVATPVRMEVRDLGFRWGSCGKSGVVFFNWKTMQLPVKLADYVLVHELVHLRYSSHSPAFWQAVERCLPDWRERQESLRTKALEIYWCTAAMVQ
jgi:predicted metal-dependent hydrolase